VVSRFRVVFDLKNNKSEKKLARYPRFTVLSDVTCYPGFAKDFRPEPGFRDIIRPERNVSRMK
jgi:hypothetical protein